jgi:ABC-type oligopeptide transport system substrate-binding subunit
MPTSYILESWIYSPSNRSYVFKIKEGVKWSDGKALTAADLVFSILRLKKAAPGPYSSILNLLDGEESIKDSRIAHSALNPVSLNSLVVRVKQPGLDLFKRLTSLFVPIVREEQVDSKSHLVMNHNISLGPYLVNTSKSKGDTLYLEKNDFFPLRRNNMPQKIEMKKYPDLPLSLAKFGTDEMWANVALDRAFVGKGTWEHLKSKKWSIWTRPVDRVMYIYPTRSGAKLRGMRSLVQSIGFFLEQNPINFDQFVGVKRAKSLQPPGFILHKDIKYDQISLPKSLVSKRLRLAVINPQLPGDTVSKKLEEMGLKIDVSYFPLSKLSSIQFSDEYDLILDAFGAADPDPVTWLSLVFESDVDFIGDWDKDLKSRFTVLKREMDTEKQHQSLRELLHDAGKNGYYVPLAHYSTIAISNDRMSLNKIREIDETVDLHKIEVIGSQ